jgi:hypothetical protein
MWRAIAVSVAFAFPTLGCAQRGDEPALPDVVLTTAEEPGLAHDLAFSDAAPELPELVCGDVNDPLYNGLHDPVPIERPDQASVREASSPPFWLAEFPEAQWPDSRWFPQPEEPEWEVPGCAVNFMSFPSRRGAFKSRLLRELGGTDESERAVALALKWLARQQQEDGGWQFDAGAKDERVAATGLALLAFFGAGESHELGVVYTPPACQLCLPMPEKVTLVYSKHGMYCRTVRRGLDFLLKHSPLSGPNNGRVSENRVSQAIATMALCEAYGMTRDRQLLPAAQAAVNDIVRSQAANGGWANTAGSNPDMLTTGWQIQALKTARLVKDVLVPEPTFKKAVDFLNHVSLGPRKAAYGSTDNTDAAPGTTATAVGLLCRYLIDGMAPDRPTMVEGVAGLMKKAPVMSNATPDMHFSFPATQLLRFHEVDEGEEWQTWNSGPRDEQGNRKGGLRDWLVSLQHRADGEKQGSFDPDGGWVGKNYGRLGTTAFAVLTMEVYYRHLPLYKRVVPR